jgi:hypothetical protein
MLRGERSSDAGISEFDLVITDSHSCRASLLFHVFLTQLSDHLHFFSQRYTYIVPDIFDFLLELNLFLLALIFFLDDFANVCGSYDSYSYISISEPSHIVRSITSINDASLGIFEVLDDHFFVVRRGSGED